jgi:tricorn protease
VKQLILAALLVALTSLNATADEGHLMRYANIHGDWIVFTYEDDLWLVPQDGGLAHRITSDPGVEAYAHFSPDGKTLAFTASYDGEPNVYLMDAEGGVPKRLTFASPFDKVLQWYPDGKHILFRSRRAYPIRAEELYSIDVDGGMPQRIPIDRGGLAALNQDATKLAYNRISRENATWKRYKGGEAQEIWLADFNTGKISALTDYKGTDNYPMWYQGKVYFTSDRSAGTLNLFSKDPATGAVEQLTSYDDYDVKYPSMGDGRIIFQYKESLHVLDLSTKKVRKVDVQIPSDRVSMRPEWVKIAPRTGSFGLSPDGEHLLLEDRGDIAVFPVEDSDEVPFVASPGSASREKDASWSPDGKHLAWVSDATGEEEIWLADAQGNGKPHQLTHREKGFMLPPKWSPDSRYLLYSDKFMDLVLVDAKSGNSVLVDHSDYDDAWERWGIQDYVFSPDSQWIAYTKQQSNMNESIFLYNIDSKKITRLTDTMTTAWSPSFDPGGDYLYFLSKRSFEPVMGFQDQNHVFLDMTRPYLVLLRNDQVSPYRDGDEDEASSAMDGSKGKKDSKKGKSEEGGKATRIDLDGIQHRVLAAEGVDRGNYFRLTATKDGFVFLKKTELEFLKYQNINDRTTDRVDLYGYDLKDAEAQELMSGIQNFHLSADNEKLVYRAGTKYGVVDAGKPAKSGDGVVDLSALSLRVVRAKEYKQIFDEAWRIERDWFYDPGMHGVDWDAMRVKYGQFVPYCGTRGDLNYLIGEMIAELNIGHTYVWGGDQGDRGDRVGVGMLGCDFDVPKGAKHPRISHIIPGVTWDESQRSPLNEPGCPIREGDYLVSIDGQQVNAGDNVYSYLVNRARKWVVLGYSHNADGSDVKQWRMKTLGNEWAIRYREWVENNRAKVDEWSGGTIGYVHLPDMMTSGLIEFARYWYPQTERKAFIIDDRYNSGGFVGDMIIDRLERKLWGVTAPREGKVSPDNPERAFYGPMVVLINEDTGSNGEFFSRAIQIDKLAPIMGMRTWGGAIGIEPHQDVVDGGTVTPPQFGLYGLSGEWLIEGVGVVPDIEVQNMPADVVAGKDTQLHRAVDYLSKELKDNPNKWVIPPKPAFPDKSKPSGK